MLSEPVSGSFFDSCLPATLFLWAYLFFSLKGQEILSGLISIFGVISISIGMIISSIHLDYAFIDDEGREVIFHWLIGIGFLLLGLFMLFKSKRLKRPS